jgi:hypothetical protein
MELLLNLIWGSLALSACFAFMRRRRSPAPCLTALIALSCIVWLLFPIVSASDDLHPTQAVLEDATKRIQQSVAPIQSSSTPTMPMLPAMLALLLLATPLAVRGWAPIAGGLLRLDTATTPRPGRAPPAF